MRSFEAIWGALRAARGNVHVAAKKLRMTDAAFGKAVDVYGLAPYAERLRRYFGAG